MSSREFCEKSMLFVHMILMHVLPTASVRGMPRLNRHFACRSRTPAMGVLDAAVSLLSEQPASVSATSFFDPQENTRRVGAYADRVKRINTLEDGLEELEDEGLAAKTRELRERLQAGASLDELLDEAFAVVREAAWRTLELRHYDVQLVGAMALHDGLLAQMGTGEGKTLVATAAVYLNALSGRGAMVVTVNDYLARRDAETMGQVYSFLGLSVGCIQQGMSTAARRAAYASDVTYVTNSELGFDYLRDNLAMTEAEVVLPAELPFCVVDEGDSVLVDEARVPLVISGKLDTAQSTRCASEFGSTAAVQVGVGAADSPHPSAAMYASAAKLAAALSLGVHYDVFEKEQTVTMSEQGLADCARTLQVDDLYNPTDPWAAFVVNAIKAKELFVRDKAYIVREGEALIVDEFSGRVMEGRRWGDGLHQAIEAKEGLEVQPETEVIASITYQSLFRRFEKLSSMSGTALTEAGASFRAALLSTTRHTRAPRAACPETPDPTQPQRNSGRYTS